MRRTMLFLPGNTPNMLINGDTLGADTIIFDLEDAVSPDEKDAARILVRNALKYQSLSLIHISGRRFSRTLIRNKWSWRYEWRSAKSY